MNIGKILKSVLVVAAPVVATAIGGPAAGALTVSALGGGALAKVDGKRRERETGYPVHKISGPLAALGVPTIIANLLPADLLAPILEHACALLCVCPGDAVVQVHPNAVANLVGLVFGLLGLLAHTLGKGAEDAVQKDRR